jgi:gluconokinase
MRVLALDIGSSSVRALVYDANADPVPGCPPARRPVPVHQDDTGRGEIDPHAYLDGLVACLDELAEAGSLRDVELVVAASQWHSVLAVGGDGEPLSPVLTWLDSRAHAVTPRVPADAEAFHERTGTWVHPLYWTTKVPWLRQHLGATTARFVGLPDYLRGVLLGDDCTSVSVASGTGLLDLARMTWDAEALDLAGLSTPEREVPAIDDAPRRLARPWRDRWPALADADWHAVLGDGAASNLGSGCGDASSVAVTVGTSAALRVVHGPDVAPPPATVWRYRVDPTRLVSGIAFSGGGVLHAWAVRLLDLKPDAEPSRAPGTSGLVSIPLHAGSRPPGTVPPGSGLVAGLSLDTTAEEFLAATMEGVALEAGRALDVLEASFGTRGLDVVLGGGAVYASPWWCRAFAAALDRPMYPADDREVGARGAVALALGLDLPRPHAVVTPNPEDAARMRVVRSRYERLRDDMVEG